MSAMTVKVTDSISSLDVAMTCPNVTVTLKTVSCVFTVARGSELTGNFNYNASNAAHSIVNIPGKDNLKINKSYFSI